jgi:hypothetical protein
VTEKIIDVGPIQISADKQETVNLPPYVEAILLILGVVVYVATSKKP